MTASTRSNPHPASIPRPIGRRPLAQCAISIARAAALARAGILVTAVLLLGSLSACDHSDATPLRAAGTPEARIGELIEAFSPLDRTVTSDVSDAKFVHGQKLQAELCKAGPAVGHAALVALKAQTDAKNDPLEEKPVDVERALLTVAAFAAPKETQVLLENLLTQYGASLQLRTEATLLLAQIAPERAIELLEPLVTKQKQNSTMPDEEFLLKAWIIACDKTKRSPVPELCDVATNLFQPGYPRVIAVRELGKRPDPRGEAALRTILVESTGDGYLRRITVQSIHALLPRETACELFHQVAAKEADMNFLRFLADAIEKWCG
jgi:hypothetical protein